MASSSQRQQSSHVWSSGSDGSNSYSDTVTRQFLWHNLAHGLERLTSLNFYPFPLPGSTDDSLNSSINF